MRLRSLLPVLGVLIGSAVTCQAQVSAGLILAQDHFMSGEAIPVSLRITNFSGQVLKLGADDYWVQFILEAKTGRPIASIKNIPVQGEFELPNATIATKRLDLAPNYPPLRPGRYILSASLYITAWGQRVPVPAVEFDIISGAVLWEQAFGVPRPSGTASPPETRRYALQQAAHLKKMKLYVRVTDATGDRPLAVFPIGPMLTFSSPEKQIDRQSKLHILYQYGARSFYYCIIDPDGILELRHTYDYALQVRPTLRVNDQGQVLVLGGARRRTPDDLPAESRTDPGGTRQKDSLPSATLPPAAPEAADDPA